MKTRYIAVLFSILTLSLLPILQAQSGQPVSDLDGLRKQALKHQQQGNFKEALEDYSTLATDPQEKDGMVGNDLENAVACMQSLNRIKEADAFREKVVGIHPGNWRVLAATAKSIFGGDHNGTIVAGVFERGPHRGQGKFVQAEERDRIRALQLMVRAMTLLETSPSHQGWEARSFYEEFARMLMGFRGYQEAWRLQVLSDLTVLPDYEEGNYYWRGRQQTRGAPVDENGNPVFYRVPAHYEDAVNDGERWRWMLKQSVDHDPSNEYSVRSIFAQFLSQQFGVESLARGGWHMPRIDEDDPKAATATLALHTLADNETIARLATGVKRFTLPPEFDFIRIYRELADTKSGYAQSALNSLAEIFTNRRQYDQAATCWRESIKSYGDGSDNWKQKKLDQIVGNWGRFEPSMTHPAGQGTTLEYRFRNGTKVVFDAREIKVPELLADIKDYLKSNPRELDWERTTPDSIGTRLVEKNQTKYLGREAARWELPLTPKPHHFDKVVTVNTGLKKAGAYLLTATMANGNVSKIVVWVNDTVIVRKQADKAVWFYVADAVSGKPLAGVNVEFFGYRQDYIEGWKSIGRRYNVLTTAFAEFTNPDGQLTPARKDFEQGYQWLVTATTADGRLAYLGFSPVWYGHYYDQEYNQRKVFGITDRPVYRPDQKVNFKFWIRHARYDEENSSDFTEQDFAVIITNPKGDKVFEKTFRTDAVAGLQGEMTLPKDAALGQYYAYVWKAGSGWGGVNFRVEEYKKPEFEVKVDAPKEPVMLGESITAMITAKYYFGTAVQKAKVKYKVTRSSYTANWYPPMPWDWFYGPGYWWFVADTPWFPGWRDWGCFCPRWWWWPAPYTPPELVAEAEVPIGADGTVKLPIDTRLALEMHGDTDHKYEITAEVTDESRRTIVGQGTVLVARKPFKVHAWVNCGHYRPGDVVKAEFAARTLDGNPVKGRGHLVLYRVGYKDGAPVEKPVRKWDLDTNEEGLASQQIQASSAGQYRLSYTLKDEKRHSIEGGYVFVVRGEGFDGRDFKFSELELVPEKREYRPGDKVRLMINTDHPGATILLFIRPANGVYLSPKILRLTGKSTMEEIEVTRKDMPNFFVEAMTVFDGRLYSQTREIIVPPEKRVLNVEVLPSAEKFKPGEHVKVRVRLTDFFGKPFAGSMVMSVYDKAVEYISGGSNVTGIRDFFWKWRRQHYPHTENNLERWFTNLTPSRMLVMDNLGVFGEGVVDEVGDDRAKGRRKFSVAKSESRGRYDSKVLAGRAGGGAMDDRMDVAFACAPQPSSAPVMEADGLRGGGVAEIASVVEPVVRTEFADTAYWNASLATDTNGVAEVSFKMPENLTGWKIKTWAMGHGTKVGEGVAEVVTAKNVMLRLQAPRFFVEKDEVVLSANVHNTLKSDKPVQAVLEVEGGCLEILGQARQTLKIKAGDEQRVDWRVRVMKEGLAVVRMKVLTDEESDAMEMKFPVYVHGMLKTESWSGVLRPDRDRQEFALTVPAERRPAQSRLELRYSPTLAGALVDALPYMVDYPYGCTEQTLNRFLPTVLVQKTLKDMGLDLKSIREKQTNLNAQETGDDRERAAQWKRNNPPNPGMERNPVFDEAVVNDMVKQGLKVLTAMQCDDGGWGWFSGWGEHSWPHTTATVVHGLQIARQNGVALVPGVLERGVEWLGKYQAGELRKLRNASLHLTLLDCKDHADDMDAFAYMVLVDADHDSAAMRDYLYNGRTNLSVYAKAMFGLALHKGRQVEKRDMILRNIGQYLVRDPENQTAYLNLGNGGYWWCWYGSENEAHAYYLKLLAATAPKGEAASELVKYLLNNRKHATYWNSTRDTALCIEAMAEYLKTSGEDKPDMTVEILLDGRKVKESRITADNLFSFDNKLVLTGTDVTTGKHTVEVRRQGRGPVYFNAYLTNFTLEDPITRAGLEIKVNRSVYKLIPANKTIKAAGSRGQALDQKVEKYERKRLADGDSLKSGDLIEVELEIASKNDYEYVVFEDMKAAGFEPVEVRSGFNGNDLGAFVEFRDERVCFFLRQLARGQNSVSYRLRAEIPGLFSALPSRASAMYAPELKANSDEIKLRIED